MKKTSLYSILISGVLALSVVGCSSSTVKRNADQEFPLEVTTAAPAFIFPISLHGVPGDTTEVGLAISSGAVTEYGASVISGQQLYSVVGNLSWKLGENMRRQASQDKLEMTGSAEQYAIELDKKMKTLTGKLKDSGVTLKYVGQDTTLSGTPSDVVMLTFQNIGDTPQNKYHIWIDGETKLVSQWAYFRDANDTTSRFTLPWNDYNSYGKVLLSGNRGERSLTEINVLKEVPEGVFESFEVPMQEMSDWNI